MRNPMIMTPGPTYVHEDVRRSLSREITNPDLDPEFFEQYKETCTKLKKLMKTENDVLIFCGEGILGLEAACASLIEPGDRVLCIENGIFGKGFGGFQKMYGAEVVYFQSDYRRGIDVEALRGFLEKDHDFKLATAVHCETPSGITNPIDKVCPLLKEYGILTVVDAVSSLGGEELETDKWGIDMVLCGSQKCLSAPPGLSFFSISSAAWSAMLNRKTPIAGFYVNIANWRNWYEEKWFPYTQPISDIMALDRAVERLLEDEERLTRHSANAESVRKSINSAGLELYPLDGFSNTVTTIKVPEGISFKKIFDEMLKKHNILIAGAFDFLKDKVIRIGHMGENCREERIYITLKALDSVLRDNGVKLNDSLHKQFVKLKG
ncbi:MAG: pyridoxal-phosphate-dependent aminotransferase family protein [Caulobacteraceae bacterium]